MNAYKVHMPDEEKIVDAEVQKKEPEKKLTRKEKKEKKKKEKQEKKEQKKKKHSPKFWMGMMILFVVVLALAVFLPDYLAERNTAAVSSETAAASASPVETAVPSSSPEASPTPSSKVQETAPSVPSASALPKETTSSERIYTAGKRETLQMIAEKELGDINLWKDILKENPDLGEMDGSTVLKEGQKLNLPEN